MYMTASDTTKVKSLFYYVAYEVKVPTLVFVAFDLSVR